MWKKFNDGVSPQGTDNTLTAYTEAVEEFSSSTAEFLSHIPLLTKARDAYQRAMAVSTQLRKVLDTGDETLQIAMEQLKQAVNTQLNQAVSDMKKTEATKVETIRANGDKADAARA
jgi:exonuclease VII small subunit